MASPAEIYQGLLDRGMTPAMAHGVMANFQAESGFDAGINERNPMVEGSRGGFGLAQWTGPRRRALEAFAEDQGTHAADTDLQLDFLMQELQGPEARAMAMLQEAETPEQAAVAFARGFERPAVDNSAHRARIAAGLAGRPYDDTGIGGGPPSSNYRGSDSGMQMAALDEVHTPPIFAKQHAALLDKLGMDSKKAGVMGRALSLLGQSMMG